MKKILFVTFVNMMFLIEVYGQQDTIIYAHRGFRGIHPENTIPAMLQSLNHGADVLEMDIAFSKDKHPILSHDPWMDSLITLDPSGRAIARGKGLPLYEMTYEEIQGYNVGVKQHKDFPMQVNFPAHIPKLFDLIDEVESYVSTNNLKKPWYSIETKSSKARDNKSQPAPEEFVKILMSVILEKGIEERVIIQSFDERTLEIVNRDYPQVTTMLNVNKGTLEENLARLTFKLDYYAPSPKLIDATLVAKLKNLGIKIIGGNTNDKAEIDRLFSLGVYEYCTDYPYQLLPKGK